MSCCAVFFVSIEFRPPQVSEGGAGTQEQRRKKHKRAQQDRPSSQGGENLRADRETDHGKAERLRGYYRQDH